VNVLECDPRLERAVTTGDGTQKYFSIAARAEGRKAYDTVGTVVAPTSNYAEEAVLPVIVPIRHGEVAVESPERNEYPLSSQ
jgi:hypothetical protein